MSAGVPFAELATLANRKRPSAVERWCQARGILYFLDADNRPCTTRDNLNAAVSRGRKTEPDWTTL